MSRFVVAPAAREDLDAIWSHIGIENGALAAADRLVEELFDKFALLAAQPQIGERCHEFEHLVAGLRRLPVRNYIIYYAPTDDGVRIGHVARGMRDQEALFRQWLKSGDFD